jgi:uncharacterized membrane protein
MPPPRKGRDHNRRDEKSIDPVEESIETILRLESMELRRRNWSDGLADSIAGFTGSIAFVILHLMWFSLWAAWNSRIITSAKPFDPYPFQLLVMIVSLEGVLLVTFVLIKQNRLTYLPDRRAHPDPQINLLAGREATHFSGYYNAWRTVCRCRMTSLKGSLPRIRRLRG